MSVCGETIASLSYPVQASQLRLGSFSLVDGCPCKIIDYSSSGSGKHGVTKIHFVALDLFTKKRHEFIVSSTKNVQVPVVEFGEYQLINIDEEYLSLLNEKGEVRSDIKLPRDKKLSDTIEKLFNLDKTLQIYVMSAMGYEEVTQYKELND